MEGIGGVQQALRKLAHIIQGLNFMPGRLQRGELSQSCHLLIAACTARARIFS
jgi:hypothetical protein